MLCASGRECGRVSCRNRENFNVTRDLNNELKRSSNMKEQIVVASEPKNSNLTSTLAHEMRKNRHRLAMFIIAAISVLAALTSCEKDKDTYTIKLLETVTYISETYNSKYLKYKFEYDEQDRITKMSEYSSNGAVYCTYTHVYAGNDLVQVVKDFHSDYVEYIEYEYTKNGNSITQKITHHFNNDYTVRVYTIELDSDELPVKREREEDDYGNTEIHTYEYQEGNMIKRTEIWTSTEYDYTETRTYPYYYDNEMGALFHCNTPKWYLIIEFGYFGVKNNITSRRPPLHVSEGFTNYRYDSTGFPTKRTVSRSGHMTHSEGIEEFTYIKK